VFKRRDFNEAHELDDLITHTISEIDGMDDDASEEKTKAVQSLKILMEARVVDMTTRRAPVIDPNVIISAAASLAGIIAILGFEKANVITTKAVSFVPKMRT
jgi:aspartate-semialdehyde dehydrogenase